MPCPNMLLVHTSQGSMPCPNMLLVPHLTRFNAMPKHVAGPTPHKVQCHAQTCCWSHTSQGSMRFFDFPKI